MQPYYMDNMTEKLFLFGLLGISFFCLGLGATVTPRERRGTELFYPIFLDGQTRTMLQGLLHHPPQTLQKKVEHHHFKPLGIMSTLKNLEEGHVSTPMLW